MEGLSLKDTKETLQKLSESYLADENFELGEEAIALLSQFNITVKRSRGVFSLDD